MRLLVASALLALAGCAASETAGPRATPPPPTSEAPRSIPTASTSASAPAPRDEASAPRAPSSSPQRPPPRPDLPVAPEGATVRRRGDRCFYVGHPPCPPKATCSPPPPMRENEVRCPDPPPPEP